MPPSDGPITRPRRARFIGIVDARGVMSIGRCKVAAIGAAPRSLARSPHVVSWPDRRQAPLERATSVTRLVTPGKSVSASIRRAATPLTGGATDYDGLLDLIGD